MGFFDFLKKGKDMASDAASKAAASTTLDDKVMGTAQDVMGKATDMVQDVAAKTDLDERARAMAGNVTDKVGGMMGGDNNTPQA